MHNNEMIIKLGEDPIIKELHSHLVWKTYGAKPTLVGGAIVDILEGRKPKDYDFLEEGSKSIKEAILKMGFKYSHESKSAVTYTRGEDVIQILRTSVYDFDYTISQASLSFKESGYDLDIDEESFELKVLKPIELNRPFQAIRCLMRKPHWERKGYTLPEETYFSLIRILNKRNDNSRHS